MLLCCINYNMIPLFSLVNELLAIIGKCYDKKLPERVQNRVAADPVSSDKKNVERDEKANVKAEDY